ncbi:MAG: ribonuclease HI family protein [Candidatus Glassbacteria bacterium]
MASFEVYLHPEVLAEGARLVCSRDGRPPEIALEADSQWRPAVEAFCARVLGALPVQAELVDARSAREGLFGRLTLVVRCFLSRRPDPLDSSYRWERSPGEATATPVPGVRIDPAAETVLATDGGSRGNPGPAGIGLVLEQPANGYLEEYGRCIGSATSNVAEYAALVQGLKLALERGVRRLVHKSDSELLVRQIDGRYKVKNFKLAQLNQEARNLIRAFESFECRHVPRNENLRADRLVNLALDQQETAAQ